MGRHSPGHVCRRPRQQQQHSYGNRGCSQPCRHQQDQQIQPTIRKSYLHSSDHLNSWYLAPPALELVQELGRRATDYKHGRLQRDHLPVPAVISGFAKGELTRSRFRTRSQPASLLQPVIYFLINSINAYGFVLAGQKNKNAINIALNTLALWH